jgi:MYXO-CTERM domain-containing protein
VITNYFANGALCRWNGGAEGWFDGNNFPTGLVPLPQGVWAGLAGLAAVGFVSRRRKSTMN